MLLEPKIKKIKNKEKLYLFKGTVSLDCLRLRLYQVGNTSSHKNTEVKQLGPRLALGWVTIQGLDVDAVATNTVKSQMRRNGASKYASGAKNKKNKK